MERRHDLPFFTGYGSAGPRPAGPGCPYTRLRQGSRLYRNLQQPGRQRLRSGRLFHRRQASGEHEYEWNGATWRFSSADNLNSFKSNPQAYAPQYGGYCAWAVSQGYTASSDPQAWRIHDGKLYLNYSEGVQKTWAQDVTGNITKADTNWPKVLDK
jgi:YHS domain-containing protein